MTKDEAFEKFWNTEIVSAVTGKVDVPMWGDIDRNDTAFIFMAGYNACKEALEQPAQEPVGEVTWFEGTVMGAIYPTSNMPKDGEKLYTHPAQPLSDDEIIKMQRDYEDLLVGGGTMFHFMEFARAIEQAHGIGVKE
jgi:hypothetical protein